MSAAILVIEDDPASLDLITYLLTAHGYRASAAVRGDDGLVRAREQRPDLVLCDIQLPGMDGYEIAAQLKSDESLCTIPLIAVTAMAMVGDRDKVLAAGFDAYISKPVDPQTFIAQIEPFLWSSRSMTLAVHAPAGDVKKAAPAYRGTILVVDDSAVNVELKRSIFEPLGYRILAACTVADGLLQARERDLNLIILDIGLPDASGLDFLRRLQSDAQVRDIPVVIITSTHAQSNIRREALALGAKRFLIRPMDSRQVLREIEACLAETQGGVHARDSRR